jgi:hypothetical protein
MCNSLLTAFLWALMVPVVLVVVTVITGTGALILVEEIVQSNGRRLDCQTFS